MAKRISVETERGRTKAVDAAKVGRKSAVHESPHPILPGGELRTTTRTVNRDIRSPDDVSNDATEP